VLLNDKAVRVNSVCSLIAYCRICVNCS